LAITLAVEALDVVFEYDGRRALDSLSLAVPQGSIFGLLGPNGSGKSTLISLLAAMQAPQAGSLTVLGEKPGPRLRSRLGILFQETCLDPLMTVEETLRLHGKLFGFSGQTLKSSSDRVLALLELDQRAGDAAATLSGGMKRRLELARALLTGPELLLLDEPSVGLDLEVRSRLWGHLRDTNEEETTLIVATNDVLEAERYCHSVAFLSRGRTLAMGTPDELKRGLKRDSVRLEWPDLTESTLCDIASWPGVGRATWIAPILHVTVDDASSFVPRLFQAVGEGIRAIHIRESTLEDAYFQLVGLPIAERQEQMV